MKKNQRKRKTKIFKKNILPFFSESSLFKKTPEFKSV